jgi:pimeloyl-ACP methyl ester carboxylesterase
VPTPFRPLETSARGVPLLTADGVRLSAHHDAPRAPTDLAVVVAHGFTLSWAAPAARVLAGELTAHAGVVSFDFRGHGRSAGVSTVGDLEVHDVDAAIRYARWLGYRRVVTLGFSLGAAVVVRHAGLAGRGRTRERTGAVAAVSGPSRWNFRGTALMRRVQLGIQTRTGRVVVRHLFGTRVARLAWQPWPEPPDALAGAVAPTPLLVVHGDADPFFPLDHAHWLHEAAREPKELWVERGFGHAEVATAPDLVTRIAGWLDASSKNGAAASARMRR